MNPMTNVKNIKKLSEEELKGKNKTSWHQQYRGSAWIFVGGLPYDLTEGDIICVFSQFGEPLNVNLVRDKDSGKSKGFCFICYEDQRSTDLAVDNLNGIKILGRTLRVDHVEKYKPPKSAKDEELKVTSGIKEEKIQKIRINDENGSLSEQTAGSGHGSERRTKNVEKIKGESEYNSKECHKKKKTDLGLKKNKKKHNIDSDREFRIESKGKKNNKRISSRSPRSSLSSSSHSRSTSSTASTSSSSASSSSSSSSSSSLSSSSLTSLDECNEADKKNKRIKKESYHKQKRNRTIEDLKREAKLIQAELKRRQQKDEEKKSRRPLDEKQLLKHDRKSECRSSEKRDRRGYSKDRRRNFERRQQRTEYRDDKRERSNSSSRDRRRSRSSDTHRENGHRYRNG